MLAATPVVQISLPFRSMTRPRATRPALATAPPPTIEVPGQGTLTFEQSQTAANPAQYVTLDGQTYQQAFDAEFNGTTLNTGQWDTDLNGQLSEPFNGDQGIASASQDVVSGGQLLLGVADAPPGTVDLQGNAVSYLEGAVNSSSFVLAPNSIFQWQGSLNWDHATGWATSLTDANHASYIGEIDNGEERGRGNVSDDVHVDRGGPPSPAPAAGIVSAPPNVISSFPGHVEIYPAQVNTYTAEYNADGTVNFYVTPTYGPGAGMTYSAGTSDGLSFNPNDPRSVLALFFSVETDQNYGLFDADANGITTTASVMKADGDATPLPRDYAMAVNWARVYSAPRTPTATVALPDTADAYVQDGAYSNVNYGAATPLLVKDAHAGNGWVRTTYLEFNLSGVNPIIFGTLNLYGSEQAGAPEAAINVAVYPVTSSNWTESTITDANAPAIGSSALASADITGSSPRVYSFDVSSYLEQQQAAGAADVTLAVAGVSYSGGIVGFNSREAGPNPPQLFLNTLTPQTSAPAPISFTATADAYVRNGTFANTNNASSAQLLVKDAVSSFDRVAYFTFDVAGLTATNISQASLDLFGALQGGVDPNFRVNVLAVSQTNWNASTLTFNNAPATGGVLASGTIPNATSQWYTFNLTAYLQQQVRAGETSVSVAIAGVTNTGAMAAFNSSLATSNLPKLVVTQ